MSFADDMKRLANSAPKHEHGPDYWDECVLKNIYGHIKDYIAGEAKRGRLSGQVGISYYNTGDLVKGAAKYETDLFDQGAYGTNLKNCIKLSKMPGFFGPTVLLELTTAGKIVCNYISREARKDGIRVSFCARYKGKNYQIGVPTREKKNDILGFNGDSVSLFVRYEI